MKRFVLLLIFILFCLSGFSQSRYISETTKKIIFARDGGSCQCCGSSLSLEYDHITPFSCGGNSDVSNIQLLCQRCNRSKSNSCHCNIHQKKVGTNCCQGDTSESNSSKSTTSTQCSGITQKGLRCKNKTTNSNGRCHLH
jgi:hypothetical protein